jgi:tetratricopeptide (TPR) repeat protein
VFAGDFDVPAAAAVAEVEEPAMLDLIDSLQAKSLLTTRPTPFGVRYRMLETLRAYSHDKLIALGEIEAVRDRHASFYTARWDPVDRYEEANLKVLEVIADMDNLRAASAWTDARGQHQQSIRLFSVVGWIELSTSNLGRFNRGYEQLQHDRDDPHSAWAQTLAAGAAAVGMLLHPTRDPAQAAIESSHAGVRADGLVMRAALTAATDPAQSLAMLDLVKQIGGLSPMRQAWVHIGVGKAMSQIGQLDTARRGYEDGLVLLGADADAPLLKMVALVGLAALDLLEDQPQAALDTLDNIEFVPPHFSTEVLRAIAFGQLGPFDAALDQLRQTSREAHLGRIPYYACPTLIGFAGLALTQGDDRHATELITATKGIGITGHAAYWLNIADRLGCGAIVRDPAYQPRPEPELAVLLDTELEKWAIEL